MKIEIKRNEFAENFTGGELFIDGKKFCDTIEDTDRMPRGVCLSRDDTEKIIKEVKVAGKTCIPSGHYKLRISFSNRFQKRLPEILDVPGFTGIRIHSGNKAEDSEGCILVGKRTEPGWVSDSRNTMTKLMATLEPACADNLVECDIF